MYGIFMESVVIFKNYAGGRYTVVLFLLALLYLLLTEKDKRKRAMFVYMPVSLLCGFFFPITRKAFVRLMGEGDTYYRMLWLVPMGTVTAYGGVKFAGFVCEKLGQWMKRLVLAALAAAFFERLGFEAFPKYDEKRTDIIAALRLGSSEKLIAFCEGIQSGSPVDSFVTPEPWDMPGYDSKVIMAAGAFTMGASIELSADAPLREPFAVWLQGGITFSTGKAGIMLAAQRMAEKELL